jgi:hypothetical protein
MNAREFLEQLLPPTGVIFTASPRKAGGWNNQSHRSLDTAVAHINRLTFEGQPAYFALATYDKERYWDAEAKNPDGTVGRWRTRTQENARYLKSFFLDLDVDPSDEKKFSSKAEAITELKALVKTIGLPKPMVVDSGGGLHAYWPLSMAVPVAEWRPVAEQLKAICLHRGFRADRSLTSDQARVLRALGSYNVRRDAPVQLLQASAPIGFTDFAKRVTDYADSIGVYAQKATQIILPGAPAHNSILPNNLGATNDPLNFDRIVFSCAQLQLQVGTRGRDTGEQLWRAALGIAKFCEPQEPAWRALSDGHPEFNPSATQQKIINWKTGPTTCEHFHQLQPKVCEACPHWGKLTSPAQLGRQIAEAPRPVVVVEDAGVTVEIELPDPPYPYIRRKDGAIVIESEESDEKRQQTIVVPYDLYPMRVRSQNGSDTAIDERSLWRVHLPLTKGAPPAPRDLDVPLQMLADQKQLAKYLMSQGVILSGEQVAMTHKFMSAYLQKLAAEAGREKLYERLGWHDDHSTFVLGDRVMFKDGAVQAHNCSTRVRNFTKGKLVTKGTLAAWQQAMQFYNRPGYEGHRFFLYCAFGAPLFHMNDTGNRGVLLTASGLSGRGKTTCLQACSAIWGHPDALILNGNKDGSTVNALYSAIGTVHSLPFLWDDITERDPEELRRFLLNISQGQGKRRMTDDHMDTWETIVMATANTDDISRILSTGQNVDPHLMRMIGVEFANIATDAESKIRADEFLRALKENYGHAGAIFMKAVVSNYDKIRTGYIKNVAMVDRMLNSANASAERFWSATVAAAYTAAQIASALGLITYPFQQDLQWMVDHLTKQRQTIRESTNTPLEQLATFLDSHLRNTLILSNKQSSNLDNVAHRPADELLIRHELDAHVIYISRNAMRAWCAQEGMPFRQFENALESAGVITRRQCQKVLGADTVYAGGQTRCWQIDGTKVNTSFAAQTPPPTPAVASNVVPINKGKAA